MTGKPTFDGVSAILFSLGRSNTILIILPNMESATLPFEARWTSLTRAGGLSLIAAGVLVLVTIPLIPMLVPSLAPASTESGLQSIKTQAVLYGITWGLYLVSDLLFVVAFLGLFALLRRTNAAAALIATIFTVMFVTIDVGIDIPLRLALIGLGNSYASATSAPQQAAYVATAQLTMDMANLTAIVATFLQFFAVILVSVPMLRDPRFGRRSAYVGIAGGILGLLFIPTFALGSQLSGLFNIGGFILLVIWSLLVGVVLYRRP